MDISILHFKLKEHSEIYLSMSITINDEFGDMSFALWNHYTRHCPLSNVTYSWNNLSV